MLEFINRYLTGIAVPALLIPSGIFFSFRLGFFWLRHPVAVLRPLLSGKPRTPGGTSPRRALCLALAGTLGVGNVVGVSAAIYMGGAGAVFWMWISALAASALKYAETVLALRHRVTDSGRLRGGAPYYIRDVGTAAGLKSAGKAVAGIFAFLCLVNSLSMGCVVQVNAVSGALFGVLDIAPWLTGAVFAVLSAVSVSGGLSRISRITSALVPFMSVGFFLMSAAVLIIRADAIPGVIRLVITDAFDFDRGSGFFGGVCGFLLSRSLRYGTMRGLITNEAGAGTSPLAHASSDGEPAEQGFLGIAEVTVDTVILCAMTAAVILVGYDTVSVWGDNSVMMTVSAYSSVLGKGAEGAVCVAVLLFGVAAVICQSFYALESLSFLLPRTPQSTLRRILAPVFAVCSLIGALSSPGSVWGIADLSMGLMTLINVVCLLAARKEVVDETRRYFIKIGKKR